MRAVPLVPCRASTVTVLADTISSGKLPPLCLPDKLMHKHAATSVNTAVGLSKKSRRDIKLLTSAFQKYEWVARYQKVGRFCHCFFKLMGLRHGLGEQKIVLPILLISCLAQGGG